MSSVQIIQAHGGVVDPTFTSRCTHLLCESQVSSMYAQVRSGSAAPDKVALCADRWLLGQRLVFCKELFLLGSFIMFGELGTFVGTICLWALEKEREVPGGCGERVGILGVIGTECYGCQS